MKQERWILGAVFLTILSAATAGAATAAQERGTLAGEIMEVRQSVRTENEGAFDEIRVRTREGQDTWVRLGPANRSQERWQVGDRVRARFVGGAANGQAVDAVSARNYRTGTTERIRSGDGTRLRLQTRDRLQDGSGSGTQARERRRDRIHEPGTGSCDRARGRGGRG